MGNNIRKRWILTENRGSHMIKKKGLFVLHNNTEFLAR